MINLEMDTMTDETKKREREKENNKKSKGKF
jgi:hypothetical protein